MPGGRARRHAGTDALASLTRLGGVEIKALNVAGITVNTLGGAWYTVAKYRMRLRRDREKGEKGVGESEGGAGRRRDGRMSWNNSPSPKD